MKKSLTILRPKSENCSEKLSKPSIAPTVPAPITPLFPIGAVYIGVISPTAYELPSQLKLPNPVLVD